jgi:hypothetical protein
MKFKQQQSRGVVDLDQLIKYTIDSIKQVEYWKHNKEGVRPASSGVHQIARPSRSSHTKSVQAKYFQRIARHVCNELYNNQSKNKENKLELSTFHRYLTKIKNTIRYDVARHSDTLPASIDKLVTEYPQYSKLIKRLLTEKDKHVNKVKVSILNELNAMNKVDADNLYTDINELAKKGGIEHPIIKYLSLTPAQAARRKSNIDARLQERKTNKQSYNLDFILELTTDSLKSNNFNELALGIALATGRRAIEVIYRGEFKAKSKNVLSFSGQAKKGKGVIAKAFDIPTLIDTDLIIDAVSRLKATERYETILADIEHLADTAKNDRINTIVARMLNHTAKRKLTPDTDVKDSPVKFKDTRVIALQVAILKIMPLKKYSKLDINEFAKRFEGHDNYEEFANYQHISVIDQPTIKKEAPQQTADSTNENVDVSALEVADAAINEANSKPLYKLHERVKALANKTGLVITQTSLYKGQKHGNELLKAGGSLALIKKYLALPYVEAAVNEYNKGKI